MKKSKHWLYALATALGCAVPVQGFCDEAANGSNAIGAGPTSRRLPEIQQVSYYSQDSSETSTSTPSPNDAPATAPADNSQASCDCMNSSCCDPGYQLIATAEATFFWPQFHRNFLTAGYSNGNGTQNVQSNSQTGSTDGTFLAAPRITLGAQGERWGFVGRYWNASSWSNGFTPFDPALTSPGINSWDGFRAYTADLEAQRRFCLGNWTGYGFGGVRYASVNNDRTLTVKSFDGPNIDSATSLARQQFNGTGITFGLYGTRPLGCCDSPLKLFLSNRYSVLWGTQKATAQSAATVTVDNIGFATDTAGATAIGRNADLFIGELQAGLQWDAQLQCLPGRAFIRTGFEYQYWTGAPAIQASASSIAFGPGSSASASANAGHLLFSLVGFNIGAGIMY